MNTNCKCGILIDNWDIQIDLSECNKRKREKKQNRTEIKNLNTTLTNQIAFKVQFPMR